MVANLFHVFSELRKRYKENGMEIYGGFSPFISNSMSRGLCNYIEKDNVLLSSSGGIANDEATLMHCICQALEPKKILVIGNSYGFSTLFLSLTNPESTIVAFDKFRVKGIELTSKLVKGLPKKHVIKASTPDDIPNIIDKYFGGSVDFVLIDAVHTNEMQSREFLILDQFISSSGIVIFHDVLSCNLLPSFFHLRDNFTNYSFKILHKSSTGIGVAVKNEVVAGMLDFLEYFSMDEEQILKFVTKMLQEHNPGSTELFKGVHTDFQFPPHPQL